MMHQAFQPVAFIEAEAHWFGLLRHRRALENASRCLETELNNLCGPAEGRFPGSWLYALHGRLFDPDILFRVSLTMKLRRPLVKLFS
jgi:hypothetical protein